MGNENYNSIKEKYNIQETEPKTREQILNNEKTNNNAEFTDFENICTYILSRIAESKDIMIKLEGEYRKLLSDRDRKDTSSSSYSNFIHKSAKKSLENISRKSKRKLMNIIELIADTIAISDENELNEFLSRAHINEPRLKSIVSTPNEILHAVFRLVHKTTMDKLNINAIDFDTLDENSPSNN